MERCQTGTNRVKTVIIGIILGIISILFKSWSNENSLLERRKSKEYLEKSQINEKL